MSIKTPRPRRRWGHITLLDMSHLPLVARDYTGKEYIADTRGGPLVWNMECDCGIVFSIPDDQFPGKRKLKSCGRPECPFTPKPKPKRQLPGQQGTSVSLYLNRSLENQLLVYAGVWRTSLSGAIGAILKAYIADESIPKNKPPYDPSAPLPSSSNSGTPPS